MPLSEKNPNVFQDQEYKTWWYVWSGYSIGPWDTEEHAIDEFNACRDKMNCSSGSCEE